MSDSTIPPPPAVARPSKPVSEALLNEKVSSLNSIGIVFRHRADYFCPVGSLSLFSPNPLFTRSRFRSRLLSAIVQAEGMACICRDGFRCWKGL